MLFPNELLTSIREQKNELAKSLIKNERLQDAVDESNSTLLHYAAEYGNSEIVQFLVDGEGAIIDNKVYVNIVNDLQQNPLLRCITSDSPCTEVVDILLEAGAKVFLRDTAGNSVFELVTDIKWLTKDIGRFEILQVFLEQDKNLENYSALLIDQNKEVIKSLLPTYINVSATDAHGRTLVHLLAMNPNPGVMEQLGGRNYVVNIHDDFGWTPLMYAIRYGFISAAEFLLKEGADIEATDKYNMTALCIAFKSLDEADQAKRNVQVLLEHGANVQVEINSEESTTIFDWFDDKYELAQLPLAHLALQEALGTTITNLIRSKLNSNQKFKSYFEYCQQQLSIDIYPSVTLLDLLTAGERNMERYLRNEELAAKLIDFQTEIYYFDKILSKRVSKAKKMIELRKSAAQIVCKLIKVNYDSYPFLVDEIVSYLEEEDIECLILIGNELSQ